MINETTSLDEMKEDNMRKQDWNFDFVLENVTAEQADKLMDIIIAFAESHNTVIGGGFAPVKAEGLREAKDEQDKEPG